MAATVAVIIAFNNKLGPLPPMGKLLNPATGLWANAESNAKPADEQYNLAGLKAEVKVHFDERMVPHVFAQNDEDLYYMQGYLTAKFRLWQMEVQTHNAAGRVSEIAGEKALKTDRLQRRIGMVYGAEEAEKYINADPESKKLVEAYCAGVNAYINNLQVKDYPLEYKLLNYKPEEWKPIKVALLLKNMANMLSVFEYDIENANFVSKYGMEEFRKLYPDFVADEDPIVSRETKFNFSGKEVAGMDGNIKNDSLSMVMNNTLAQLGGVNSHIEKPDEITGSNNWAVSGSKTKSGGPMLCNDPHLKLSLPSIWYEMHLVSPNMNVYGATIPGAPAVIIGFNDSISWGVTNGGRDVRDWYQVKFKDANRDEYEYNGKWLKSEKRVETYKVAGGKDLLDTVIYTKFGIVVFDKNYGEAESSHNLAMRWTAHLPSNEFKTFYLMNQGKNYDDYINALKNYTCPAQNFVFASRSGDIAIKEQGRFPIRNKATEQGKYLSNGSSTVDEWTDFIPYQYNPTDKNPARGFVSSANQHPTDSTYPYYYPGVGVYENYRNRRINQVLAAGKDIDMEFMKKLHSDNYNMNAAEALPTLLALLDSSKLSKDELHYVDALSKWNYFNDANQIEPVYYEIWFNELRRLLWDEMLTSKSPMKQPDFYVTVQFLKTDSTSHFYDNQETKVVETRTVLVQQSFAKIKQALDSKEFVEVSEPYGKDEAFVAANKPHDWGTYKDTKVAHLAGIDAFSRKAYNGGNRGIVNATNNSNGPSWRMIVDEGTMKAYVVYPGGESGNPGSKYYDNMVDTWAKGEYYEANFVKKAEDLGAKRVYTATFSPKK